MKLGKLSLSLGLLSFTIINNTTAQSPNTTIDGRKGVVSTAVPFLGITPDSRSGAMGDVGIAISPDANAQYHNIARIAMSDKQGGLSMTLTPWLRDLGLSDVYLAYIAGYYKFGRENNQAISGSIRYFNLGDITWTEELQGNEIGTGKPRELSFDMGYSRKLSDVFSIGANLRYIYSNIAAGSIDPNETYHAGNAFSTDVGAFYTKTKEMSDEKKNTMAFGAVIRNLGSKISYTDVERDFIPTTLGIGGAYTMQLDYYNKFTVALDLNKAMTPTPIQKHDLDSQGDTIKTYWDRKNNMTVVSGFLDALKNAPPGYGTTAGIGAEYWYQDQFAARAGYFYEAEGNGNRQYFTVGAGARYNVLGINVSYLIPSGNSIARNPLSNTLRFSLLFDFDKEAIAKWGSKRSKKSSRANNERSIEPTQVN